MKKTWTRLSIALTLCFLINQIAFAKSFDDLFLVDTCALMNYPVAPSDSCLNAPPFCSAYLNGFCSVNNNYAADTPGNILSLGCSLENNQWLSFIPCEDSISFIISVGNCFNSSGLEFNILQTDDCLNFNPIATCFGILDETIDTLTVTSLVPGETYLLMVDGIDGDICQWEIVTNWGVSDGSFAQELITSGHIEGECDICLDAAGPPSEPFEYVAFPADCQIIPIDTDCAGNNNICPPAFQQFCEPHLDTIYIPTVYDTVWHITPPTAGYFVNDDSIGMTVEIIWDSIGTFYIDAELIPIEYDTVEVWEDCIKPCLTVCPDPEGDDCSILQKTVHVGMPDMHFFFFEKCPEECVNVLLNSGGGVVSAPASDTISSGSIEFCFPGVFEFFALDNAGCPDQYTVEVEDFFPQDEFVTLQEACPGDCVQFMGETYCPGNYQVPSFDQNGCFIVIHLEVLPAPTGNIFITVSTSIINCFDPVAVISVGTDYNGAVDYVWMNGEIGDNIVVDYGGLFSVDVYGGGCFLGSQSVFISEDTNGEFYDLGEIVLCPGDCFELIGDQFCDEGVYQETYINPENGCEDTYVFTITIEMNPGMQIGPVTEVCDGLNETYSVAFSILGGTPPFIVNGIQISGDFYQSAPITTGDAYLFQVTDNGICSIGEENVQGFFECPCITDPGTMELALLNQCETDLVTPTWNNDAVLDANDILLFVLHTESGNIIGDILGMNFTGVFGFEPNTMNFGETYYISAIAGNENNGMIDFSSACTSVSPGQPIVFYSEPHFTIYPPANLTCDNISETLVSDLTGGSGQFAFEWSGTGGFTSIIQNPTFSEGGTYNCVISDLLSGCSIEASVDIVEISSTPDLTLSDGEITCSEPTITIQANSTSSGAEYSWQLPDGTIIQSQTIQTDQSGIFSVIVTDQNGCTAQSEMEVIDNTLAPAVTVNDDFIACYHPIANLVTETTSNIASYSWNLPNGSSSDLSMLETALVGDFTLTVIGENGCDTTIEATVQALPDPDMIAIGESASPNCFEDETGFIVISDVLGATGPVDLAINGQLATLGTRYDVPPGEYLVSFIDSAGCTDDTLLILNGAEEITLEIENEHYLTAGEQVTLTFDANIDPDLILWSGSGGQNWENQLSITLSPESDETISLSIYDENGCSQSALFSLFVAGNGEVFIPNAFSPNGDLKNDYITVYGSPEVRLVKSFKIFDRWGEMVFNGENFIPNEPILGWDGKLKGKIMNPAVFGYIAEVEMDSGEIKMLVGDVTLLQ